MTTIQNLNSADSATPCTRKGIETKDPIKTTLRITNMYRLKMGFWGGVGIERFVSGSNFLLSGLYESWSQSSISSLGRVLNF